MIADETLGVAVKKGQDGALAGLQRIVEMYQYKENKHSHTRRVRDHNGNYVDETYYTYSYNRVWTSQKIDSSRFHDGGYSNPTFWPSSRTRKLPGA